MTASSSQLPASSPEPIQYVDRPPLISNTAPVENEFSSDASQVASEASSSISRNRPRGIFDSIQSTCDCDICSRIRVLAAAGVMQLTETFSVASSLPSDLVSAMTPAFAALYADALGFPSLPATEEMVTIRPYLCASITGTIARQQ